MLSVSSRMSANTAVAPQWTITFAVAGQVIERRDHLVARARPRARRARGGAPRCTTRPRARASPPGSRACAPRARRCAGRSSASPSGGSRRPPRSRPRRSRAAGTRGIQIASRRASGICGDEAYAVRGGVRPRERLLAGVAGDEHRAGPVGAAPERREDVAGLAVDPDLPDASRPSGTSTRSSTPGGATRNRVTAPPTRGSCSGRHKRVAERGVDREAVQVDARHRLDELGVVTAAEPRGDLDHLRPVGADAQLGVGRAVLDPQRGHGRRGHGLSDRPGA